MSESSHITPDEEQGLSPVLTPPAAIPPEDPIALETLEALQYGDPIKESSICVFSGEFWSVVLPWILIVITVALIMTIKGARWSQTQLQELFEWVNMLPLFPHTALLIAAFWIPCVWLSIPGVGVTLQLYAGYRFHKELTWIVGGILTMLSMLLASFACYALGRYLAQPVSIASNKYLKLLIADSRLEMLRSIVVLRLSPLLPFTLLSYLLGKVHDIGWFTYTFGTICGLLPPSLVFAYFGSVAQTVAELINRDDSWNDDPESRDRQVLVARSVILSGALLTLVAGGGIFATSFLRAAARGVVKSVVWIQWRWTLLKGIAQ
jgi:uncharacterized membrane protein YdjX (TVP38/TMEM64 family)